MISFYFLSLSLSCRNKVFGDYMMVHGEEDPKRYQRPLIMKSLTAEEGSIRPHLYQHHPPYGNVAGMLSQYLIDYDANSLYPSAFVDSPLHYGKLEPFLGSLEEIEAQGAFAPWLMVSKMWQTTPNIFPLIPVRVTWHIQEKTNDRLRAGNLTYPNGTLLNHVIDSISLREAHKAGWRWDEPLRGEILTSSTNVMQKAMRELYEERNRVKDDISRTDSAVEKARLDSKQQGLKLVMNGSYGQTNMRDYFNQVELVSAPFIGVLGKKGIPMPNHIGGIGGAKQTKTLKVYNKPYIIYEGIYMVYEESPESPNNRAFVILRDPDNTPFNSIKQPPRYMAVEILAKSKAIMNRVIFALKAYLIPGRIIYTDTDSLFIAGRFEEWMEKQGFTGTELGQFKNDLGDGYIVEMVSTAPKIKGMLLMTLTGNIDYSSTWKSASAQNYLKSESKYYWHTHDNMAESQRHPLQDYPLDTLDKPLREEDYVLIKPRAAAVLDKKGYGFGKGFYKHPDITPIQAMTKIKAYRANYIGYAFEGKTVDFGSHRIVLNQRDGSKYWRDMTPEIYLFNDSESQTIAWNGYVY